MIPRPSRTAALAALAGVLCALFSAAPSFAQDPGTLTVYSPAPTVSAGGALYNYFYVVNYGSPDGGVTDLAFVEFQAAPNADLTNLGASPGFFVNYDPTLGFVTFLETDGSSTFSADSPVSFSFSSPYGPATIPYDATDGSNFYAGTVLAPGVAPAPEPGALVSLGAGALGLGLLAARRRRATVSVS